MNLKKTKFKKWEEDREKGIDLQKREKELSGKMKPPVLIEQPPAIPLPC